VFRGVKIWFNLTLIRTDLTMKIMFWK
jgi:hypothetical protein